VGDRCDMSLASQFKKLGDGGGLNGSQMGHYSQSIEQVKKRK